MNWLEAIILGILQGLTEFIPVSSSGHLILAEKLLGFDTGGLLFDVMLHGGTLMALLFYFWGDIKKIFSDFFSGKRRLGWLVIIATIPAAGMGAILQSLAETQFRSVNLVIFNLIFVGVVMLMADRLPQQKQMQQMSKTEALGIGIAQGMALVPGVSRSGITIAASRFLRFNRESAARFAFIIAIPITLGAIIKLLISADVAQITTNSFVFISGVIAATVSGYLAIDFLLRYLKNRGLALFSYYRFALAAVIIAITLVK